MAYALDYDEISWPMGYAPTAPLLQVVLALGEENHFSGKEALLGLTVP
jgi:hypothetical protein